MISRKQVLAAWSETPRPKQIELARRFSVSRQRIFQIVRPGAERAARVRRRVKLRVVAAIARGWREGRIRLGGPETKTVAEAAAALKRGRFFVRVGSSVIESFRVTWGTRHFPMASDRF